MKRLSIFFVMSGILSTSVLFSQNVGINPTGTPPNPSAGLDVDFTNKGLLIPRVALTSATDAATIPSPATSLLVYNTGTGGLAPAGYYYNAGTPGSPNWVRLMPATGTGGAWLVTGNGGLSSTTNFLGTTDNVDLAIRTNNIERMRVLSNGNIGIFNNSPSSLISVNTTGNPAVRYYFFSPSSGGTDLTGLRVEHQMNAAWSYQTAIEGVIASSSAWNNPRAIGVRGYAVAPSPATGGRSFGGWFTAGGQNTNVAVKAISFHNGNPINSIGILAAATNTQTGNPSPWVGSSYPNLDVDENSINGVWAGYFVGDVRVTRDLQFDRELRPNGNAGTAGQVLRSQGPGIAPVWFPMAASIIYQNAFNSTTNVCINSAVWTTHPGCSVTLNLQAGDVVWAWGYGSAMADNDCNGTTDAVYCYYNVRIAVNGADFPDGAWARGSVDYQTGWIAFDAYSIAGRFTVPTSGSYQFELQTSRAGGSGNAVTAGNNTSALQSGMMIIVYRP
ncbi:MAG: hypothetical protein N2203_02385 [Bacteroidia bacterium]|nr:hypothetical protein [Bacteroidia bacterium]